MSIMNEYPGLYTNLNVHIKESKILCREDKPDRWDSK